MSAVSPDKASQASRPGGRVISTVCKFEVCTRAGMCSDALSGGSQNILSFFMSFVKEFWDLWDVHISQVFQFPFNFHNFSAFYFAFFYVFFCMNLNIEDEMSSGHSKHGSQTSAFLHLFAFSPKFCNFFSFRIGQFWQFLCFLPSGLLGNNFDRENFCIWIFSFRKFLHLDF